MAGRHSILLLDDDPDVVEAYRDLLGRLPSKPEIHTATSGARALSLLEAQPFTLLLSDLKMPKMDGLQVLTIVRRRFPRLRTAVMTGADDAQFRARAYALGIDLFLEKPTTAKEIQFFLDCIESLLGGDDAVGFRGVQSKSLVDIIQLECLSQGSSVLKVTNGPAVGRVWLAKGEITDAEVENTTGEEAFLRILSWRTGNFEILPPDPMRDRRIFKSSQGLLLEMAQAIDERGGGDVNPESIELAEGRSPMAQSILAPGVEWVLAMKPDGQHEAQGANVPESLAAWAGQVLKSFAWLGEHLSAGSMTGFEARLCAGRIEYARVGEVDLFIGVKEGLSREEGKAISKTVQSKWVS